MSKASAIIGEIERAYANWSGLLAVLTEEQMTSRGLADSGEWSVKDIVAHIGVYEWWLGEFIATRDWPVLPPHLDSPDTETRNQAFHGEYRDEPLEAVLARADHAHRSLMTAISTLTEEDFSDQSRLGMPEGADWDLRRLILAITVEHYAAHIGTVRALTAPRDDAVG